MSHSHVVRATTLVLTLSLTLSLSISTGAYAQRTDSMMAKSGGEAGPVAATAARAAIERARALVENGRTVAARTVLDSLVAVSANESGDLAEALYWRAVLGERAADAERDWKRLILDVPLSPRVPSALLRLGELEMVRGHPAGARSYLDRLLRDYAGAAERPKAMLWVARSYFDERDVVRACRTIGSIGKNDVPEGELRLQATELQSRCATESAALNGTKSDATVAEKTVADAPAATKTSAPKPTKAPSVPSARTAANTTPAVEADVNVAPQTPPAAPSATGRFSVQVAAFDTKTQAEASARALKKNGFAARVDGDEKPFRVRIGRFATRAEAERALTQWKKKGQKGFIAVLTP